MTRTLIRKDYFKVKRKRYSYNIEYSNKNFQSRPFRDESHIYSLPCSVVPYNAIPLRALAWSRFFYSSTTKVKVKDVERSMSATTQADKSLVLEATVLVLAEQREADGGQGVGLEELQALFEGVVDLDLAGAVEHDDAAGSVECRLV